MTQHPVCRFVQTVQRGSVRQVGQLHEQSVDPHIKSADVFFKVADLLTHVAHFGNDVIGRLLTLGAGLPNLPGHLVATAPQVVAVGYGDTPLCIQGKNFVEAIVIFGAAHQGGANSVCFVANLFQGKHSAELAYRIRGRRPASLRARAFAEIIAHPEWWPGR